MQFVFQQLLNAVGDGIVILGSQYWGKKQTAPIKKVLTAAFWSGIFFAVVLGLAVLISPTGLLGLLSDEAEIVSAGSEFIKIMSVSYVFFAISNILVSLMRSVETVKIGFYVSLSSFGINILLNYMLIYGKFGAPEMGIRGAAVATLISRLIEFIVTVVYLLFIDKNSFNKNMCIPFT